MAAFLICGGGAAGWVWKKRGAVIKDVAADLRAGAQSRHAPVPFDRFIELRYGPMDNPTNRQKAFVAFFDPAHMEGMYRLVGYMKPEEREKNIAASARWIARYRESMTEEDKRSLAAWLRQPGTRHELERASGLYRSRDINYRAATEEVIKELMTTLAMARNEQVQP